MADRSEIARPDGDVLHIDVTLPAPVHETPDDEAVVAIDEVAVRPDLIEADEPTTRSIVIDADRALEAATRSAARAAADAGDGIPDLPAVSPPDTRRARVAEAHEAAAADPGRVEWQPWFADRQGRPARPEGFWRELVYGITFDQVNLGDAPEVRARKQVDARIAAPLDGRPRHIAVISRKGGVGATTVTALLGMALADARDDRVLAVDAHPDRGTLADRVDAPDGQAARQPTRDLVLHAARIHAVEGMQPYVARDRTSLDVLPGDAAGGARSGFDEYDYKVVADVASRCYAMTLTDSAAGVRQPIARAALQRADAVVLVSGASADEARLTSEAVTWLEQNGHDQLARDAVVVLNTATSGTVLDQLDEIEAHFRARVRDVVRIPYDEELSTGTPVRFAALRPFTRDSARDLAATLVDGLTRTDDPQ